MHAHSESHSWRGAASAKPLTTLSYSSRAVAPLNECDLARLESDASARNRAEGLTGLFVYDDGHFFQWLEGPVEGLTRIWDSVRRDKRHTDIRVSHIQPTPARVFGDWSMKRLRRGDPVLSPASLLAATLPGLVETMVVPAIAARLAHVRDALPEVHPRAAELANLLIATDPSASSELARQLCVRDDSFALSRVSLLEPAARSLGDLWYADDCSAAEVTLGLGRIQALVRELGVAAAMSGYDLPAVLVAPQPGETHGLGATLDSELLGRMGWDTRSEFPANDAALQALLAGAWFDVLDLSLSTALRREELLPRLAITIAAARIASLNPSLVIVAGGRDFAETAGAAESVGADVDGSVVQLGASIMAALRHPRPTTRRPHGKT